ncbi:class D sortase [Heyndrickxia sp. NPDC080065]|uniref:class D sortase n=1 Tax=Heyndrickxia sp. NPDC080065 TaxID=3390568 RepID=UPI003D09232E
MVKWLGYFFLISGISLVALFFIRFILSEQAQKSALDEAEAKIQTYQGKIIKGTNSKAEEFHPKDYEAFATLEIPKLNKTLPVVEGADEKALDKGIGHLSQSVFPGKGEQIVLSGHRDTVFREFNKIEIGDLFTVHMPYGSFKYKIRNTEIVNEDDTTVIRKMGEEVLVVTTCYPFHYIGNAPKRFIAYAYPVDKVK